MYQIRRLIAVALVIITALATFGCSVDKMNEWVPAGMKKISTDAVDYNLYIPSNWEEDNSTGVVTAYVGSSDRTSVSMIAFDLEDPNQTVSQYWDNNKEAFTSFFTDIQFETEGESTLLGGVAAAKYVYTANASGLPYKFMQVICIREGTVYIFTYTATADKYDTHLQSVEEILTNFSFIS